MTDMRDAFEAECRRYWGERCPDLEFKDDRYEGGRPAIAWGFWQAATQAERDRCEVIAANNVSVVEVLRQIRRGNA